MSLAADERKGGVMKNLMEHRSLPAALCRCAYPLINVLKFAALVISLPSSFVAAAQAAPSFTQQQIDSMRALQACYVRQPNLTDYVAVDRQCGDDEAILDRAFFQNQPAFDMFIRMLIKTPDHGQSFVDSLAPLATTNQNFDWRYTIGPSKN
jgi:hypothetical protein